MLRTGSAFYSFIIGLLALTASPALGQNPSAPVPLDNPATWVTSQDYPPDAMLNHHEGSVTFRVDVGMDGRVAECHVMGSSGFDELDKATCDLVVRRARFLPARDAGGNAAPSSYQNRVRWMIPQSPPLPKAGELVVSFLVRPDGTKADCKVEAASGEAALTPLLGVVCHAQKFDKGFVDDAGRPVTRRIRRTMKVEILPAP